MTTSTAREVSLTFCSTAFLAILLIGANNARILDLSACSSFAAPTPHMILTSLYLVLPRHINSLSLSLAFVRPALKCHGIMSKLPKLHVPEFLGCGPAMLVFVYSWRGVLMPCQCIICLLNLITSIGLRPPRLPTMITVLDGAAVAICSSKTCCFATHWHMVCHVFRNRIKSYLDLLCSNNLLACRIMRREPFVHCSCE